MSTEFFQTRMGRHFYEGTMPQLVEQIKRSNELMEQFLAQQSASSCHCEEPNPDIDFQDAVDNLIHNFLFDMAEVYDPSRAKTPLDWDIYKISTVRETVEKLLELPERY